MKATINRTDLKNALKAVSRTVGRGPRAFPKETVFVNFEIDTGGVMILTTGNCNQFSRYSVPIAISDGSQGSQSLAIPFKTSEEIVSLLPNEPVVISLSADEDTEEGMPTRDILSLETAKNETNIKGIQSSLFFSMLGIEAVDGDSMLVPDNDDTGWTKLMADDINSILATTVVATVEEAARPVLHAVSLKASQSDISAVASDGFRLAYCEAKTDGAKSESLLIPGPAVKDLLFLMNILAPEFILYQHDLRYAYFRIGNMHYVTRVENGTFPDYSPMLIANVPATCTIRKQDMLNALAIVNAIGKHDSPISFVANKATNEITLSVSDAALGEQQATIDAISIKSTEGVHEIQFNFAGQYMRDAFVAIDSPQGQIDFEAADKPIFVRPVDGLDMFHLIMPVILRGNA